VPGLQRRFPFAREAPHIFGAVIHFSAGQEVHDPGMKTK
jgi:hypothetical protein